MKQRNHGLFRFQSLSYVVKWRKVKQTLLKTLFVVIYTNTEINIKYWSFISYLKNCVFKFQGRVYAYICKNTAHLFPPVRMPLTNSNQALYGCAEKSFFRRSCTHWHIHSEILSNYQGPLLQKNNLNVYVLLICLIELIVLLPD